LFLVPSRHASAFGVAAPNDEVETVLFYSLEHSRQQRFIMLHISIDHSEIGGR
jgi:hypothetical protein